MKLLVAAVALASVIRTPKAAAIVNSKPQPGLPEEALPAELLAAKTRFLASSDRGCGQVAVKYIMNNKQPYEQFSACQTRPGTGNDTWWVTRYCQSRAEAEAYCAIGGGQLASLNDLSERDFANNFLKSSVAGKWAEPDCLISLASYPYAKSGYAGLWIGLKKVAGAQPIQWAWDASPTQTLITDEFPFNQYAGSYRSVVNKYSSSGACVLMMRTNEGYNPQSGHYSNFEEGFVSTACTYTARGLCRSN